MGISPVKFGDRLVELLPQLMQEISRYENNYVTTGKITCQQFLVLDQLSRKKEWTMQEFVRSTDMKFSSATGMIDRLVKHGLVRRRRGKEDRRTVLVMITIKGRDIISEVYSQKKHGIIQLFKRLNAQERQNYLDILQKLVSSLSSAKGGLS
ncbi:MAG: MarR family transcriptional regulator [Candidatus Omnitrophica bacterium]|nr:MarR family transcriptional regulator [Candidatus Omnitrophota bacterium]MCB9721525.1 MarR family transcriptional regulator [Candidatus Omnitrophota bacterium]